MFEISPIKYGAYTGALYVVIIKIKLNVHASFMHFHRHEAKDRLAFHNHVNNAGHFESS